MAKTALNTIKSWFKTGLFPTQDQFWNWMDSFWHKDDKLPTSQITDLDTLLTGKATTEQITSLQDQINNIVSGPVSQTLDENTSYEIPAGKLLQKVVVMPSGDLAAFAIGSAEGVTDILPAIPVANGDTQLFTLELYAKEARTIWFNGITSQTDIKIYLQ